MKELLNRAALGFWRLMPTSLVRHLLFLLQSNPEIPDRWGYHIRPIHYYEPLPDFQTITARQLVRRHNYPAIDFNWQKQIELISELGAKYRDELEELARSEGPQAFDFHNDYFPSFDAAVYYALIRFLRPTRVIEVGCGYSTQIANKALMRNQQDGQPGKLTCIEPYPQSRLNEAHLDIELIKTRVEELDLEFFSCLKANDILFIDSSHTVKFGSDVCREFLEILPALRPGVWIHVHDIFFPYDYPAEWLIQRRYAFNEQYLLEAFLSFNQDFHIALSNFWLGLDQTDIVTRLWSQEADPCQSVSLGYSSFWFYKNENVEVINGANLIMEPPTSDRSTVSAIVPTIGRPDSLKGLLQSLSLQSRKVDEVVISDGSSDNATRLLVEDPRWNVAHLYVRHLAVLPPNAVRQREAAIHASEGDMLLLLDDDVVLERDCVEHMLALLQANPSVVAVTADFTNQVWPQPTLLWQLYLRYALRLQVDAWQGRVVGPLLRFGYNPVPASPKPMQWLGSGNSMVRRSAYLRAGGFSDFFLHRCTINEDVDFGIKLSRVGGILFSPDARMAHHQAPAGRVPVAFAVEDDVYNRFVVMHRTLNFSKTRSLVLILFYVFIESLSNILGATKRARLGLTLQLLHGRLRGLVQICRSCIGLTVRSAREEVP